MTRGSESMNVHEEDEQRGPGGDLQELTGESPQAHPQQQDKSITPHDGGLARGSKIGQPADERTGGDDDGVDGADGGQQPSVGFKEVEICGHF